MTYRIKNWHKFQHFKDRRPPWIKLYRDLLDDIEWHRLAAEHAKALIEFWLLASENDGVLPDEATMAFRLRTSEESINAHVKALSHWLEQADIATISQRYQDDAPETETETETETERGCVKKKIEREESIPLAEKFAYSILSWKPDFGALQSDKRARWIMGVAADVDKMLRIDHRDPAEVGAIIDWLPSHVGSNGFTWRVNILSGGKLREKFDKLQIARNGNGRPFKAVDSRPSLSDLARREP